MLAKIGLFIVLIRGPRCKIQDQGNESPVIRQTDLGDPNISSIRNRL